MRWPRFGVNITGSEWFAKMVRKSFDDVDIDRLGTTHIVSHLPHTSHAMPPATRTSCHNPAIPRPFVTQPCPPPPSPLNPAHTLTPPRSGQLDQKELFIALLKLYDMLNGKLPCRVPVPQVRWLHGLCPSQRHAWGAVSLSPCAGGALARPPLAPPQMHPGSLSLTLTHSHSTPPAGRHQDLHEQV